MENKISSRLSDEVMVIINKIVDSYDRAVALCIQNNSNWYIDDLHNFEIYILEFITIKHTYQYAVRLNWCSNSLFWDNYAVDDKHSKERVRNDLINLFTFDIKWSGISIKFDEEISYTEFAVDTIKDSFMLFKFINYIFKILYYNKILNKYNDFILIIYEYSHADLNVSSTYKTNHNIKIKTCDVVEFVRLFGCNVTYPKKLLNSCIISPMIPELDEIVKQYL